ncbi:putative MIF4G-like domain superfamily protein [Plasmopara halstedii]
MSLYFHYLENKLVKDKRLSSRISFMIRDVIELRQHRWEPRRKELKQKTLNEIRKEAEREARAPPTSAPGGGSRDIGDRDHFRLDRRSNSSRDGSFSSRSTMAPVYQQSQSMSSRSNNKQMTPLRGIGARDESVKTGPSGRPAFLVLPHGKVSVVVQVVHRPIFLTAVVV